MLTRVKSLNRKSILFLAGIFISSLGSTAFVIGLITFPALAGISALTIGSIIGTGRFVSVLTSFFAGPIGDYISPRKIVYLGEFGALACSCVIWKLSFSLSDSYFYLFLIMTAARSFFTAIQSGSTQKVGKIYDDQLKLDGRFAKYLNQATFGATFFAMVLNLLVLKYGSFQHIIVIDAVTFLINGLLVLASTGSNEHVDLNAEKQRIPDLGKMWIDNIKYFKNHRALAQMDMLLALIMMGANTLNVMLLVRNPALAPFASGIFGLAVWLSSPVEKFLKPKRNLLWVLLAISILAQGLFTRLPYIVLAFALIRNISYWIIFNELSSEIMKGAKKEGYAGVASGRNVTINLIGALGEFWVGLKAIPIVAEVGWRCFCAFAARVLGSRTVKAAVVGVGMAPALMTMVSSAAEAAGALNLPIRGSIVNTDPQKMEDVISLFVNRQVHRGLVRYTSELELVNDLVANYSVADNGRTYIFKLSANTFSDGAKVTARDVVRTFQRMKKVESAIISDLHSIVGFSKTDIQKEIGVVATTEDSVKFSLNFADPFFIKNLAAVDCSILKLDGGLNLLPATSGRYVFKDLGDRVHLSLRDGKLHPKSPVDVNLIKISKDQQAIDLAKLGKLDSLESFEVSSEDQNYFLASGWKKLETQLARVMFLSLNPHKLPSEVRHQIYASLQSAGGKGLPDGYLPTFGIIPPLLSGSLNQKDIKDLISNGSKPKPGQTVVLSYPDGKEFDGLARWATTILEHDGFIVKTKHFALADYFKVVHSGDYQIMLRSKYLDYPDGMAVLTYFKSNLPINTFFAGDKFSDKLIAEAQLESSLATRNEQYRKIQLLLLKGYTVVPLVSGSTQSFLYSNKIVSIKAHPLGLHSVYLNEIELLKSDQ